MEWTKPAFEEIKMDAEIGSYQVDDDERAPVCEVARDVAPLAEDAAAM